MEDRARPPQSSDTRRDEQIAAHVLLDAEVVVQVDELAPPFAHRRQRQLVLAPAHGARLEGEVEAARLLWVGREARADVEQPGGGEGGEMRKQLNSGPA